MRKRLIIEIIAGLFFLLFLYTAIAKILTYKVFEFDLHRDPLLENYSKFIAVAVPTVEILIAIFLAVPHLRKIGLISSSALMILFTTYIWYILRFKEEERHCTCGGFIREMTWKQHLWFNSSLVIISLIGVVLYYQMIKQKSTLPNFKS